MKQAFNVVISGSSQGIGLACAQLFCERGQTVYGFDLQQAAFDHPNYCHIVHNICNDSAHFRADLAPIDVLINCAGTVVEADALEVNLNATMHFTEAFINSPTLSSIVFVASASARNGSEFPRYVASKAGIVGYMKNLALNLAERGITCNSISPGGVITPLNDHILKSDELYRQVLDETLLGKWAEAQEIAELAWYLTMVNKSITGEDILIDNGEQLKSNFIW